MKAKLGEQAVYKSIVNEKCGVRVTVRAVFERTAIVEYATGVLEEVQLSRLSEVPASWNEPVPSIVRAPLETVVEQFKAAGGDVTKFDALKKKRGLK